jgi:hypothetical protein
MTGGLPARLAALLAAAACREPASAAAALLLRFCLVHDQAAAVELALIERGTRRLPLLVIRHLDEAKPPGSARRLISNQANGRDIAERREELFELLLCGVE